MNPRRIEVRYVPRRERWKALLLAGTRRESAYGSDPADAVEYLSGMLQSSAKHWRIVSSSSKRVVFEEGRGPAVSLIEALPPAEAPSTSAAIGLAAPSTIPVDGRSRYRAYNIAYAVGLSIVACAAWMLA